MGLLKWLMSLGEPQQRSKDKSRERHEARKARNRTPRQPRRRVASIQTTSSPEPPEAVQTSHVRLTDEEKDAVIQGRRTAAEIAAIHNADLQRTAMAAQQQAMTQQQMNAALGVGMMQELSFLTGNNDPLMGAPTTPYWKRMYGELGKAGGPYYPKKSGK